MRERNALLLTALLALATACSESTKGSDQTLGCPSSADGCLSVTLQNTDAKSFDPSNPDHDGKGTFYSALLDQCPTGTTAQFNFVSEGVVVPDVGLSDVEATYQFEIRFKLHDPAFGTSYDEGDKAGLSGFFDDDASVTSASNPVFGFGDTLANCMEISLKRGSGQVGPLVPCLTVDATSAYVFEQSPFLPSCAAYLDGGPPDSGGSGGTGAGGTGSGGSDGDASQD